MILFVERRIFNVGEVVMKRNDSQLIVMLTHNDITVDNAYEIFEHCKNSKAKYWGIKEKSLSFEQMKKLFTYMKECGKSTVLEVVEYSQKLCMKGAQIAAECGCDILLGTTFSDEVNEFCKQSNLKYMPFVGNVKGRPSVLDGNIGEMLEEANEYLAKGVFGFDLLGYRYVGNSVELNKKFVSQVNAPVCIAGSINSYMRLDQIKEISPWAFTIGGAFFENKFEGTIEEQIDKVCDYMEH